RELELLNELKLSILDCINDKDIINNNKKELEKLESYISVIENNKSALEERIKEMKGEIENFRNLFLREILSKMRLLDYPENEIMSASDRKSFSDICELRGKVFNEFDMRFKINQVVKDTPEEEIINYSMFKI
ncbi:hypothetical protein ACFL4Z_03020, partial [candidate division KSB1 bacterium]